MKKLTSVVMLFLFTTICFSQQKIDSTTVKDNTELVDNLQQTDQVLATILDKSLKLAEKTGDFVITQAPDVLRQFYIWHTIDYVMWMIFGIGIILMGRYIPHLWKEREESSYNTKRFFNIQVNSDHGIFFAGLSLLIGSITGVIIFIISLMDFLYITFAPKLYLIEYLLKLRK